MEKPRLPGFTAEAAVTTTRRQHYRSAVGAAGGGGAQRIHPSLRWRPRPDCNPNCVCVSPIGCPCCIGPGPGWPPWPDPWPDSFGGSATRLG
jgi:hypothetical protein